MSNKFHVLDHPMLLFSGFATTGKTVDLLSGVIGVFDDKTGNAVTSATIQANRPVRFAQGSYHTKDALGAFYKGLKKSVKTADFLPKDVMHIEYSPFRKAQNEKWIFGYDGLNDDSLKFECGKTHKFRVRVYGEGVYNMFAKQILRDVSVTTACCDSDDCTNGCPDNNVHCKKYTEALVNAINNDVEIGKFVRAEVVYPSAELTTFVPTHKNLTLTVCDNGDQAALASVQAAYPGVNISRLSRNGSKSLYVTECLLNATADAVRDYTPNTDVFLSVCNECEAGYTLVGAQDVYTVMISNEDYTDAATLKAAYETAGTTTAIATTDVNTTTDVITETAHGFVTGQKIVYENGGGANITGLTDGTTYYAINLTANTFKVASSAANAFAGTAINLTGTGNNAQTFIPVYTVTELSQNATVTIVQVVVEEGVTLETLGNEQAVKGATIPAKCTATSPASIAWVDYENFMKSSRTMTATISKTCGGGSRLAEVQAFYAERTDISVALTTSGTCEDLYTITQASECISQGDCLSENLPQYLDVPPFEDVRWKVVETTLAYNANFKCGIRLEVSSNYDRFGNCSWVPEDYYTFKPTMMEIYEVEENGDFCKAQVPARKIQNAIQASQSGEWVVREYIKLASYFYTEAFDTDPRLREVLDQTIYQIIDKSAFYNVYYIKFKQYRGSNLQGNTQMPEVFEIPIVVKDGVDTSSFTSYLNGIFAPFGIQVMPREGQANY